jgi:ribose/xylose/arabinose/galactoside ABC-type transport system permease subunit
MNPEATTGKRRFHVGLNEVVLAVALVIVTFIMSQLSPNFLTIYNFFEVTRYIAEIGMISLAMTAVIATAGIDLSVGSMVGLSAIVIGRVFGLGAGIVSAIAAGLAAGALAGLANGLLITKARVPAIIATLATLAAYEGIALGISQGHAYQMPQSIYFLGQSYLGPVPVQLLIFSAFSAAFILLLSRTVFGRNVYAIGNNETAARFSGSRVDRTKVIVYTLSGFMTAVAALILVTRVSSARADVGASYMLDSIAAVVLGGTPVSGGRGSIWGTLLALLIIGFVRNGLTLAFVPAVVQSIIIGLILIVAVALNQIFLARRH